MGNFVFFRLQAKTFTFWLQNFLITKHQRLDGNDTGENDDCCKKSERVEKRFVPSANCRCNLDVLVWMLKHKY